MGIFYFFIISTKDIHARMGTNGVEKNSLSGRNSEMFMLSCTARTLEFVFTNLWTCSNERCLRTLVFIFTNRRMCSNNKLLFHLLFQLRIFTHGGVPLELKRW